jgi:hypothetical protein
MVLLEALRGKTLTLLGDSLTVNIFAALVVELRTRGVLLVASMIRRSPPADATQLIKVPDWNATIVLQLFYDVVSPAPFDTPTSEKESLIPWALFEELVRAADVTLVNLGVHYDHGEGRARLTKRLNATFDFMRRDQRARPSVCHLYRTTWHQHFLGGDGRYSNSSSSKPLKTPTQVAVPDADGRRCVVNAAHEFYVDAQLLAAYPDILLLNFSSLTRGAGHFHRETPSYGCAERGERGFYRAAGDGPCFYDCTHYCWSPALFAPAWHMIGAAILACGARLG